MAYAMTKQGSLDNCITYEFICDTIEDMNAIENIYRTIGSIAIVLQGDNGLEVYISGSDKQWNSLSSIGGSSSTAGLAIHICGQDEVSEGLPDVEEPDETTIYLVPASQESNNLYEEYIWTNDAWEKFGGASIDLSDYATLSDISGFYTKPNGGIPAADLAETYLTQHQDISGKANSADLATVATSGSYNDLSNKPTIPDVDGFYTKPVGGIPAADLADTYLTTHQDISGLAPKASPVFTGSISMGRKSGTASIGGSVAIGLDAEATGSAGTTSIGWETKASGRSSHAEGQSSQAVGWVAHAEGLQTYAYGSASHAEGSHANGAQANTINGVVYPYGAIGYASHAEGESTIATGKNSHAEGRDTVALGANSHVGGQFNVPDNWNGWNEWVANTEYAVGDKVKKTGISSVTAYSCKTANSDEEFTENHWTVIDEKLNYVEIIGNGANTSSRSNARALDWSGNEYLKGDLYVGCDADSVNGSKVATEVYVINATSGYATQAYVNNAIPTKLSQLQNDIQGTIYGFHIDGNESDPAAKVTYLADAVGKTPAYMDFANDKFEYGGWEDAFFMPRPCMLKYDGTVDYYLDPTDYSKKADGTASDIADPTYNGNAMIEWGRDGKKIWYNIVPEGNDNSSASIYIADYQVNQNYKAYSFIDKNNNYIDHFYTPCYFGTIVNDGSKDVLRSLSGQAGSNRCKNKTATVERTMAQNNGVDWDMEFYCDIVLINLLLILISKSTNTQAIFGEGLHTNGTDAVNDSFTSGQHDTKGLFYGTNSGAAATYTNAVKIFGMENWYGFMWRRFLGLAAIDRVIKYKMTANTADGSTGTDYKVSTTGSDYNTYLTGNTMPSASGTYIQKMYFDEKQFAPQTAAGTYQQDYCDGLWTNTGVRFACRGGSSDRGSLVGAFFLGLYYAASFARWYVGAAPACKPHKVTI